MLDQLTFEQMKQHVGSVFHLESEGSGPIELRLVRAQKVMESEAARLPRTPFSLHFQGPPEPYLPQKIYRMRHEAFDAPLDVFVVPIARESGGYIYEALFT